MKAIPLTLIIWKPVLSTKCKNAVVWENYFPQEVLCFKVRRKKSDLTHPNPPISLVNRSTPKEVTPMSVSYPKPPVAPLL